jgi:hypothetical protein
MPEENKILELVKEWFDEIAEEDLPDRQTADKLEKRLWKDYVEAMRWLRAK